MSWIVVEHNGMRHRLAVARSSQGVWVGWPGGSGLFVPDDDQLAGRDHHDEIRAPMTGKVIRVAAPENAKVKKGDLLVILEAMKMEYRLSAPHDGLVESIHCNEGDLVDLGASLVTLVE